MVKSPYLSEKSSDFDETWYITSDMMTVKWWKIKKFKIQDGSGRHLENCFSGHYSSTDCPISAKFCMSKQNGMLVRATGQKNANFKIQDGGQPPFWKSSNRHISVKNYPISMKFGTLQQIWTRLQSRDQKLNVLNFKTAATAVLKIVISRYLLYAVVHQILSKSNNSFTEIWWYLRETVIGFWQNLVYYSIY